MRYLITAIILSLISSSTYSQSTLEYFKASKDFTNVVYTSDDAGQLSNGSVTNTGIDTICGREYFRYAFHYLECAEYFIVIEEDKVYHFDAYNCKNFRLLYDFGLEVGDTAILNNTRCFVKELTTITLGNGEVRPMQVVESIGFDNKSIRIVQGLGNIDGLFFFPFQKDLQSYTACQGILLDSDTLINNDFSFILPEEFYCLSVCGRYNYSADSLHVHLTNETERKKQFQIDWGDGSTSSYSGTTEHTYSNGGCYKVRRSIPSHCDTTIRSSVICVCPPSYWQLDTVLAPIHPAIKYPKDPLSERACVSYRDSTYEFSNGLITNQTANLFSYNGEEFTIRSSQIIDESRLLFYSTPTDSPSEHNSIVGYIENGIIHPTIQIGIYLTRSSFDGERIYMKKGRFQDTAWVSKDRALTWKTVSFPEKILNYVTYIPASIFGDTLIQVFHRDWPSDHIPYSKIAISYDFGDTWNVNDMAIRGAITIIKTDLIYMIRNDSLFLTKDQFLNLEFVNDNISRILTHDGEKGFYEDSEKVPYYSDNGFRTKGQLVSNISFSLADLYQNDDRKYSLRKDVGSTIQLFSLDLDAPIDCRPDNDGDGLRGDDDCNDNNSSIFYGNVEIPYDGMDNDCLSESLDDDLDMDGFGIDEDCDDLDPTINPNAVDIPNGIDDNCDGIIDGVTSTQEEEFTDLKVYPSPAQDRIFVTSAHPIGHIKVIDLQGKTAYESKVINEITQDIDCSNWNNGLYIIQVQDHSGRYKSYKVVVH